MYEPSALQAIEPAFEFDRKLICFASPPDAGTTLTFEYDLVVGDAVRNAIHLPSGDHLKESPPSGAGSVNVLHNSFSAFVSTL